MERRTIIKAASAALTLGISGLAGCMEEDGGGGQETTEQAAETTTEPTETATETATEAGGGTEAPTVNANDDLKFVPAEIQISPGTTVTWENVGSINHSVTAYGDKIPDEAEYWATGDFSSESAARNSYPDQGVLGADETYEHTFEVEGTHDYFCIPHEQAGMKGTVVVGQGGDGGGGNATGGDNETGGGTNTTTGNETE